MMRGLRWLMLSIVCWATPAAASSRVTAFGTDAGGHAVSRITMTNDRGMRVAAITYGATITTIAVPDRDGTIRNVVLSLPDMPSYNRSQRRWGGIVGRYAGRIAGAAFTLDGTIHRLHPGRNGVTLHGGPNSYDKRVWQFRTAADARSLSTIFTLISPDGDQGFPGRLTLEVRYRLMRRTNDLSIEYRATTTAPTVINVTNHLFLNLGGAGGGKVRDHQLTITADRVAETDDRKIPTGRLLPVAGTVLDFRRATAIGKRLASNDPALALSKGFDHSYALPDTAGRALRRMAIVSDEASGRTLTIDTTEPGLQFNTGNDFDGSEIGSEGVAYPIYAGIALETQHLPDSPNQPRFPSTTIRPGKPFRSITVYRFTTEPRAVR